MKLFKITSVAALVLVLLAVPVLILYRGMPHLMYLHLVLKAASSHDRTSLKT